MVRTHCDICDVEIGKPMEHTGKIREANKYSIGPYDFCREHYLAVTRYITNLRVDNIKMARRTTRGSNP